MSRCVTTSPRSRNNTHIANTAEGASATLAWAAYHSGNAMDLGTTASLLCSAPVAYSTQHTTVPTWTVDMAEGTISLLARGWQAVSRRPQAGGTVLEIR